MSDRELRPIASLQRDFFRADLALASGVSRRALSAARTRGGVVGVRCGLCRFADHPATPFDRRCALGVGPPGCSRP